MTNQRILFYDVETTPLKAWVWSTGEQRVRHDQLVRDFDSYDVITLSWAWSDCEGVNSMDWGDDKDSRKIIEMFDALAAQADVIIGKNNMRFDDKMMTFLRMRHGLPGRPEFEMYTDDLERHIRKRFRLPSYTLDYVSKILGLEGKSPMGFSDWIGIMETNCPELRLKMREYNEKDVLDTKKIWEHLNTHFTPKVKHLSVDKDMHVCINCGSSDLYKNGTRTTGLTKYQLYRCRAHNGYAGRTPMKK